MKYLRISIGEIKKYKKMGYTDTEVLIISYLNTIADRFTNKNISFRQMAIDLEISHTTICRAIKKIKTLNPELYNSKYVFVAIRERRMVQNAPPRNNNITNIITIHNDEKTPEQMVHIAPNIVQIAPKSVLIAPPRNDNNNTQCHNSNNNNNNKNLSKFDLNLNNLKEKKENLIKERKEKLEFSGGVYMERKRIYLETNFQTIVKILKANGCSCLPTSVVELKQKKSFYQSFLTAKPVILSYIKNINSEDNIQIEICTPDEQELLQEPIAQCL